MKRPCALPRMLAMALAMAAALWAAPASAQAGWSDYAFISSTIGVADGRVCTGESTRGDIGCAANAPYISGTSGWMGIGTVTPAAPLHVVHNSYTAGVVFDRPGTGRASMSMGGTPPALGIGWDTGGGTSGRLHITSNSHLFGLGVNAPSTSLHINGAIRIADGGQSCDTNRTGAIRYTGGNFQFCADGTTWQTMSELASVSGVDRITSGTTNVVANGNTGYVSFTSGGTTTGYYSPGGIFGAVGISTTAHASLSTAYAGTLNVGGNLVLQDKTAFPAEGSLVEGTHGTFITGGSGANRALTLGTTDNGYTRAVIELGNYNQSSGSIAFKTNTNAAQTAQTRMYISENGLVGIGTTAPQDALDVAGSVRTSANLILTNIGGVYPTSSGTISGMALAATRDLYFGAGSTSNRQMVFTSQTQLGIGTLAPEATLTVSGTVRMSSAAPQLFVRDGAGSNHTSLKYDSANTGTAAVFSAHPQNTAATVRLVIAGGNSTGNAVLNFDRASPTLLTQSPGRINYNLATDEMTFGTNFTTRMAIVSTGEVGIGTQVPSATLHVAGGGFDSSRIIVQTTNPDTRYLSGLHFLNSSGTNVFSLGTSNLKNAWQIAGKNNWPVVVASGNGGTLIHNGNANDTPFSGPISTTLHVSGTIRLADGGETCDTNRAGAIRYTSSSIFQFCSGAAWQTIGQIANEGGGASDRITSGTTNVVANSGTGYVSFTSGGTTTGYYSPGGIFAAVGISTSTNQASFTTVYASGKALFSVSSTTMQEAPLNVDVGLRSTGSAVTATYIAGNADQRLLMLLRNLNNNNSAQAPFVGVAFDANDAELGGSYNRAYIGLRKRSIHPLNGETLISAPRDIKFYVNNLGHDVNSYGSYGTNAMTIASNSLVGIGTTQPSTALHVHNGDITAQNVLMGLPDSLGALSEGGLYATNQRLAFYTNDGSNAPTKRFQISGGSSTVPSRFIGLSELVVATGSVGGEQLVLNASNLTDPRLGIGYLAATPSATLHVFKGDSGFNGALNARTVAAFEGNDSGGATISILSRPTGFSGIFFGDDAQEAPGQIQYRHDGNYFTFGTGGGGAVTSLNVDGKWGIWGNTSATSSTFAAPSTTLHVSGTIRLADGGETCDTNRAGAIRYTSSSIFQFCSGAAWQTIGQIANEGGGASDRITSGTTNVVANSGTGYVSFTSGGTTTGYYSPGGIFGAVGISTTSNQASFTTAYASQRVLVGTTATSNDSILYVSSSLNRIAFFRSEPRAVDLSIEGLTSSALSLYSGAGDALHLGAASRKSDLIIDTAGNVGIGTQSPSATLHVMSASPSAIFTMNGGIGEPVIKISRINSTQSNSYVAAISNAGARLADGSLLLGPDDTSAGGRIADLAFSGAPAISSLGGQLVIKGATGNVGIGTTAPSTTLHVSGTFRVSQAGTSTNSFEVAPYTSGSGTDLKSSGQFIFFTGGTRRGGFGSSGGFILDNALGTTAYPSTTLHVSGTIRIADSAEACDANRAGAIRYTSSSTFDFCDGTTGWKSFSQMVAGVASGDRITSGTTSIIATQDQSLSIAAAGSNRMLIGANGNITVGNGVGFGSIVPDLKFDIRQDSAVFGQRIISTGSAAGWRLHHNNGVSNHYIDFMTGPNYFNIEQNDVVRLSIASPTGYIGIGTTDPSSSLHIYGSNGTREIKLDAMGPTSNAYINSRVSGTGAAMFRAGNGSALWTWGMDGSDSNKFKITSHYILGADPAQEAMVIDRNTRYVGLGTATPSATLHVNRASTNDNFVVFSTEGTIRQVGLEFRNIGDTKGRIYSAGSTDNYRLVMESLGGNRDIIADGRKVGIGGLLQVPSTTLHVSGTIRIADSAETCDANRAGAIRYTSSSTFDFCDGTTGWKSFSQMVAGVASGDRITSGSVALTAYGALGRISSTHRLYLGSTGNTGIIDFARPSDGAYQASFGWQDSAIFRHYIAGGSAEYRLMGNDGVTNTAVLTAIMSNSNGSFGRIGIGATAPSATLDVSGTLRIAGTGSETCDANMIGVNRRNPVTGKVEMCRP